MITDFEFHNVSQNSDEWFDLRLGRATASNAAKIMANYPKAFGDPAKKYAMSTALERVTKQPDPTESFSNSWTDRGHELEPIARELYEIEHFAEVQNGGFYCNEVVGDSPDGVVGDNGRVEIKCVGQHSHWKLLDKGGYDSSYKWQIQWHMLFGADWCDFISYCPEFPIHKRLYVFTVKKDLEMQKQLIDRLAQFEAIVQTYIKLL